MVGDHMGIPRTVVSLFAYCRLSLLSPLFWQAYQSLRSTVEKERSWSMSFPHNWEPGTTLDPPGEKLLHPGNIRLQTVF
jgi:hypothetical protein